VSSRPSGPGTVHDLFADVEAAHRAEDVDGYLSSFADDAVWVTSRGRVLRGRVALDRYLRQVLPGGLGEGSVTYVVESVHDIGPDVVVALIEQTYVDHAGRARDADARHTHSYVLRRTRQRWYVVAGQNTVRRDDNGTV
jgi:uncharacterized protein (TIGR02246 family)